MGPRVGETKGRTWGIVGGIALVLFGLRALRALIPSHEPDPVQMRQQLEALQAYDVGTRQEDRAAVIERAASPGPSPNCSGFQVPQPVRAQWAVRDELTAVLGASLANEGAGASITSDVDLPFELPPEPAFQRPHNLRMRVQSWQDPSRFEGGSVGATVSLHERDDERAQCVAFVELRGPVRPSINTARFELLWAALRQGALQLRPSP